MTRIFFRNRDMINERSDVVKIFSSILCMQMMSTCKTVELQFNNKLLKFGDILVKRSECERKWFYVLSKISHSVFSHHQAIC